MYILYNICILMLVCGGGFYLTVCLISQWGYVHNTQAPSGFRPHVSVIIPARNEAATITQLLDDLFAQDYPAGCIQIIAVDDQSDDTTGQIIAEYAARDSRIVAAGTSNSTSPYSHKKRAVHEGILRSGGELILTVDADCRVGRQWISAMAGAFTSDTELVAGEIDVRGTSLLGWIEELEFTGIQTMAAGLMNIGFPVTCNGGNLAYRRSAFERVKGFSGIGDLVSGDDDLLMQKIAGGRHGNTLFVTGRNTSVRVDAAESFSGLLAKRIRWVSKIHRYPSLSALMLMVFFFSFFVMVPLWTICAVAGVVAWYPLLIGYGLKMTGDLLVCFAGLLRKNRLPLIFLAPFAELVHVPYLLYVTVRGTLGTFEWHGRSTGAVTTGAEGGGA